MKRLLSITLALTLLGSSVAMARGYQDSGYGDRHGYNGYSTSYRGEFGHRDHDNNTAVAVGAGILALGLFAALASQHNDHYSGQYYAPPPPPRPGYGNYGSGYGHSPGYGYGYGGYYGYER